MRLEAHRVVQRPDDMEPCMPLSHIEHFLVAADDIDATRDWYARVLGLTPGPHPEFGFPVHWMYIGDTDVVHIGPSARVASAAQRAYLGRTSQDSGSGTGAIDHIAFRATGLRETLAHLSAQGIRFNQRRANGQALVQLFFHDPNGVKIELNFAASEAEGDDDDARN
jgi:catechol 2,3-dioxygenase-like lactoylglutathione lyase family enzyme